MKTTSPQPTSIRQIGFTLIEMIGVLAIMSILAAVITPNALRIIEREAVRAEADTLHNLGEQAKLYLRNTATEPTAANWYTATVLASPKYALLSPADLLTNRRQMTRLYVPDPIAANHRAMFLSSMRTALALPNVNNISANFTTIWNTTYGNVPAAAGWGSWNTNNIEYLIIERVSFQADLQDLPVHLTTTGPTGSYRLMSADGLTLLQSGNVTLSTPVDLTPNGHPNQRLNLYRAAGGVTLDYSYVLSTHGGNFEFNGTNWILK